MAPTNRHTEHAWPFYTGAARQANRVQQVIRLWPHFAYQNGIRSQKPFRMISLREIDLQPSWNDILTKNIGGWGYTLFSNAARRRLGCGVFANLYERPLVTYRALMSVTSSPLYLLSFNRLDEKSLISPLTKNFLNYRELSRPGRPIRLRHSGIRALLAPALEQSAISCCDVARGHGLLSLI
jgi:hypothetical protein